MVTVPLESVGFRAGAVPSREHDSELTGAAEPPSRRNRAPAPAKVR
jgi:hypothetical protein